jgi:nicotinate-nucleotide adenylyltransferase
MGAAAVGGRVTGALGVFGGTFDPIHVAHLAVAEAARDALGLERVLFVPNRQPPHKPDQAVTAAADRLAMVRAAIADNPAFEASTIEIDRDGPSYTADTLAALGAQRIAAGEPGDLALILSVEALAGLATWHEPQRVLALSRLVVAPRDGYPDVDPATIARLLPGAEARIVMLDGPRMRLSASEIRTRAAARRSLRYLVPDAVAAYIGDHGLYTESRRMDRS